MTLLSAHALGKHFGERRLFEGVTFDVGERDKIGLVGDNGCGKTTLFRMITGEEPIEEGEAVRSKETRVGYMEQHACSDQGRTLWDEVESVFAPVMAVEAELNAVTARLAAGETGAPLLERQHLRRRSWRTRAGCTTKAGCRATLLGLGFDEAAFSQPVGSLSGGQRSPRRPWAACCCPTPTCCCWTSRPTIWIWMPLNGWEISCLNDKGTVVTISHDRYFLDQCCDRIIELFEGHADFYAGSYSYYAEERKLRFAQRMAEHGKSDGGAQAITGSIAQDAPVGHRENAQACVLH